jgi:methylenetetrahydrofolate dehydrogenase (NADP+) / methenyltetrahydrofolate cyclohydrolase
MMPVATILDGKALAQQIRDDVRQGVAALSGQGIVPRLNVALVGDDGPSALYVRSKEKACAEVGIQTETARLPASTTQEKLLGLVAEWNRNPKVHGILVQLPVPEQIDPESILMAISPRKDVDGLNPMNLGRILSSEPDFYPATPSGILEILSHYGILVAGRHVVIVGRGELVGKPLANMLLQKKPGGNATVTVCHSQTPDIGSFTRQADIVVAAAGKANLIRAEMVKAGVVVIDVGTNRIPTETGSKLVGDVDFAGVASIASAITPVPGGIGPMTVAMLLKNTVKAAKKTQM